jgi:hypothetical protein
VSFAQLHKLVVYGVSGLGLLALALGGELSPFTRALCAIGFIASWFVEPPRVSARLMQSTGYGWAWASVLGLAAAVQLGRWLVLATNPLLLMLELSCVLVISRLMSRRSAAEYQQIVLLSFLHLGAATVMTSELSWAIPFMGFVLVMPWALALSHLRTEIEAHFEPASSGDPDAGLARVLRSRRLISGRFLAGTASLSVPMFLVTIFFFVLFPRVGMNFLAAQRESATPLVGFDDEVVLGEVGTLRGDGTVVMRVTPLQTPESPPRYAVLHLRGSSFDRYDGRAWSRTPGDPPRAMRQLDGDHLITRPPDPGADRGYRIVLSHLDPPVIFLPQSTVAITLDTSGRSTLNGEDLGLSPGLDVRYDASDGLGLRYVAWTEPAGAPEHDTGLRGDDANRYLALPEGHDDVIALARRWTEGASSDRARAERLLSNLRDGELDYSLTMRAPGDRTPLSAFLFVHRAGHCEYFATALAIMLRAVGIPSREITGFLGGQWNAFGGYYAVRSSDAHAWVEAYLPGEGWVTLDPTPANAGPGAIEGLWTQLSEIYEALAADWNERVVSWDLGSQRSMFRGLFRWLRQLRMEPAQNDPVVLPDVPDEEAATDRAWQFDPWLWVGIAALVVLVALLIWRRRQRAPELDAPRKLLADLDRALARRGRARPESRTPLEHARTLRDERFVGAQEVHALVDAYVESRFGGRALSASELTVLRARAKKIGSQRVSE